MKNNKNNLQNHTISPYFTHPFDGHLLGSMVAKIPPFNSTFLQPQQIADIVIKANFNKQVLLDDDFHKEKFIKSTVYGQLNQIALLVLKQSIIYSMFYKLNQEYATIDKKYDKCLYELKDIYQEYPTMRASVKQKTLNRLSQKIFLKEEEQSLISVLHTENSLSKWAPQQFPEKNQKKSLETAFKRGFQSSFTEIIIPDRISLFCDLLSKSIDSHKKSPMDYFYPALYKILKQDQLFFSKKLKNLRRGFSKYKKKFRKLSKTVDKIEYDYMVKWPLNQIVE